MRTLPITTLLYTVGLWLLPIITSHTITPEERDGPEYDLEDSGSGSGSGSGEWSEESKKSRSFLDTYNGHGTVKLTTISTFTMTRSEDDYMLNGIDEAVKTIPIIDTSNIRNKVGDDSDLTFDIRPESVDDTGSAIGNVAKSEGLLKNKEALAAIIAGGVVGLALAASLASFLIYNMKKKDVAGYTLGQQKASNEAY